jgi:putative transposase
MDFVHDSLFDGRRFRVFTLIDEFSRESPALEVDVSLTAERVTRVLDQACDTRGFPAVLQADNGPEFTSRAMHQWAYEHGVRLQFIEPGKPTHNAIIESFNSRLREEFLNEHVFVSLDDARRKIQLWQIQYNRERPHSSLGYPAPEEFAARTRQTRSKAGALDGAPPSDPKSYSFSSPPSRRMKCGPKNWNKKHSPE